jgi:hypothetical protein
MQFLNETLIDLRLEIHRIGRRFTLMVIAVPFLISWGFIIFANGAGMLYAGRFFAGGFIEILLHLFEVLIHFTSHSHKKVWPPEQVVWSHPCSYQK